MASGLMTYSQFKSSRQNSMNGSSAREKNGAEHPPEEGEFEQVWIWIWFWIWSRPPTRGERI